MLATRLVVLVNLVGGDHYPHARIVEQTDAIQHVGRTDSVDLESLCRYLVRGTHNGLRRQMEDNVRLEVCHTFVQVFRVANVPDDGMA